jgi:hypothetical protein
MNRLGQTNRFVSETMSSLRTTATLAAASRLRCARMSRNILLGVVLVG